MDKTLDFSFSKTTGLKWLPWIGNEYLNTDNPNRLFVIGETHYHDNTLQSIKKHESPAFTREVVEEMAIERDYYQTKIFQNFHKALFRNDSFDSHIFWNHVSFYNFIQRPMATNKGRPNYEDFFQGWKSFFEVVKLTNPDTCLFIGTSAADYLTDAIKNTGYNTEGVIREDYISNAFAKTSLITDSADKKIKLIFIRHTSQMFSWDRWNAYLRKKMPTELQYFENKLYPNTRTF